MTDDNQRWYPWQGPLAQPYRLRYHKNRNPALHPVAASLLAAQILPAAALNWLAQYRELYEAFLFCISGHYDRAGILGELVREADRASVAQFMGANPSAALERPQPSLAKQLLTALRELVQTQLTLSHPHSGSDGWLTEEALWLVSKTTADRIRAWLLQQGITGVPDSNIRLFDEMQAHGLIVPTPEGRAIWSCDIISDSGWTPGCPLTLLRLSPSRLWHTPEERPVPFAGRVRVVSAEIGTPERAARTKMNSTVSPVVQADSELTDLAFSLFAAPGPETTAPADSIPPAPAADTFADVAAPGPISAEKQPQKNTARPASLPDNPLPSPTPVTGAASLSGEHFITWLRAGIQRRHIAVNDTLARVHRVEGRAFLVSPEIFKLYVKTTTGETGEEWKRVQKAFQKLKLHQRGDEGMNIFTCEVKGPRKTRRVKGYLLERPEVIFGNMVPEDNPYLSIVSTS